MMRGWRNFDFKKRQVLNILRDAILEVANCFHERLLNLIGSTTASSGKVADFWADFSEFSVRQAALAQNRF